MDNELNILLADDDKDDCDFFSDVILELNIKVNLQIVNDGNQLTTYLHKNVRSLPDGLFLDLNMPRKNGYSCLLEIRSQPEFNSLPIIIYSTSYIEEVAQSLFENGAQFYFRKPTDYKSLKTLIYQTLELIKFSKGTITSEKYIINKSTSGY